MKIRAPESGSVAEPALERAVTLARRAGGNWRRGQAGEGGFNLEEGDTCRKHTRRVEEAQESVSLRRLSLRRCARGRSAHRAQSNPHETEHCAAPPTEAKLAIPPANRRLTHIACLTGRKLQVGAVQSSPPPTMSRSTEASVSRLGVPPPEPGANTGCLLRALVYS